MSTVKSSTKVINVEEESHDETRRRHSKTNIFLFKGDDSVVWEAYGLQFKPVANIASVDRSPYATNVPLVCRSMTRVSDTQVAEAFGLPF